MLFPIIILFSLGMVYLTIKHIDPDTSAYRILK